MRAGWRIADLPALRPGDWAYVRTNSIPSWIIRFLFKSHYNHALWIAQIFETAQGVVEHIGIIESVAKGVSPGDLWDLYHKSDIAVMRADCDDETAKRALAQAYKYGRKRYDFLIPFDTIRRYGWRNTLVAIWWILRGEQVLFPHVKDERVVCVEEIQEPYSDIGFPLIDDAWLLAPHPSSSPYAHPIFYGYNSKKRR